MNLLTELFLLVAGGFCGAFLGAHINDRKKKKEFKHIRREFSLIWQAITKINDQAFDFRRRFTSLEEDSKQIEYLTAQNRAKDRLLDAIHDCIIKMRHSIDIHRGILEILRSTKVDKSVVDAGNKIVKDSKKEGGSHGGHDYFNDTAISSGVFPNDGVVSIAIDGEWMFVDLGNGHSTGIHLSKVVNLIQIDTNRK